MSKHDHLLGHFHIISQQKDQATSLLLFASCLLDHVYSNPDDTMPMYELDHESFASYSTRSCITLLSYRMK